MAAALFWPPLCDNGDAETQDDVLDGFVAELCEPGAKRRRLATDAVELQLEMAAYSRDHSRENLVEQWREVSKPRRAGAVAKQPRGSKKDFPALFDEWLKVRDLHDSLRRCKAEDQRGWRVYRYTREPVVKAAASWEQAFHGTWWYSVWSVIESGVMLESDDRSKGHDFWEPGVYCSPNLDTGRWYARPHILFGDGVYHRVLFELRVDPSRRKKNRQRGGVQWVFPAAAVALYAVWVQLNAPPKNGEERVNDWDPLLEALPPERQAVSEIANPRVGPWPEPEGSDSEDGLEEPVAPHLADWPKSAAASCLPSSTQSAIRAFDPSSAQWSRLIKPVRAAPVIPKAGVRIPAHVAAASQPQRWQDEPWLRGPVHAVATAKSSEIICLDEDDDPDLPGAVAKARPPKRPAPLPPVAAVARVPPAAAQIFRPSQGPSHLRCAPPAPPHSRQSAITAVIGSQLGHWSTDKVCLARVPVPSRINF